jgi:NDP-sugar pyrophosphorylase family protein
MKAILLSGGEGTRVRPFTASVPKPLLPVANVPLISYQFSLLKKYGFDEVIVGVGYKADSFSKAVGPAAKRAGVKAEISPERKPLGTGGGLGNARGFFGKKDKEPFVVFNGDVISDFNLEKILSFHKEKGAFATIGLVKVNDPSSYGLVMMDSGAEIKKFIEKPGQQDIVTDTVNAGVYVFSPEIFGEIPEGRPSSLEREVIPSILDKGMKIAGSVHYGYWIDVGTVELYRKANFDALEGKAGLSHDVKETEGDGRLLSGRNTVLKEGVKIKGRVIIGDNCFVGRDCMLEESIVLNNTVIRDRCAVSGSIIGTGVLVDSDCTLNNAVLADGSLIRSFTKIISK